MTDLFSAGDLPETHKPKPLAPLMLKDEILSVDQAAYVVGKSTKTIRDWNDEHVIGQQSKPGAPLEISWIALLMVANGDLETLERFRLGDRHSWHLYVVRLADGVAVERDAFIERLFAAGIGVSVHYIPLHLQPYWRDRYGLKPAQFPHSQRAYERMVSLPLYTRMTDADVDRVCAAVRAALAA